MADGDDDTDKYEFEDHEPDEKASSNKESSQGLAPSRSSDQLVDRMPKAPRGLPNFIERIRSVADKKYYQFKADEINAHTNMTNALRENLQARDGLKQAIVESEEWNEQLERKRIRTTYEIEDMELDANLERRKHELALDAHRRQVEYDRLVNPPKSEKPRKKDFRAEAEEMLKYGNAGPNLRAAHQVIEELIKERGGEDKLTEEDRERIELLIETARRKDMGKS